MNWFSLVGSIFKPAAELIDNLHTSDEERLKIKQAMFELQVEAFNKADGIQGGRVDQRRNNAAKGEGTADQKGEDQHRQMAAQRFAPGGGSPHARTTPAVRHGRVRRRRLYSAASRAAIGLFGCVVQLP